MKKMVKITCTMEQLATIKTALKLEYERNYGQSTGAEKLIKSALEAVNAWKWEA